MGANPLVVASKLSQFNFIFLPQIVKVLTVKNRQVVKVIWHQSASSSQTDGSIVFARQMIWRYVGNGFADHNQFEKMYIQSLYPIAVKMSYV